MDVVGAGARALTRPTDQPANHAATNGAAAADHGPSPADPVARTIPPLFTRLCDDAALFPPGDAAPSDAVPAHREYRGSWYRNLIGPFLATAKHVPEVAEAARANPAGGPLSLVLVVPDGPGALAAAIQTTEREPGIELVGVELACAPEGSSSDAAREAAWMLERELPPGVGGVVEVRRDGGLEAALDVVAASPYRAKLRTGGTVAQAFPSEDELAVFIVGCVDLGLPFKCTAGLHEAVRHTDPKTGFEHHGFLNVLAATSSATAGANLAMVAQVLSLRSGLDLVDILRVLKPDAIHRTRQAFTAFGTCSITEPLTDLIELGAL